MGLTYLKQTRERRGLVLNLSPRNALCVQNLRLFEVPVAVTNDAHILCDASPIFRTSLTGMHDM
jgi:hypothetical protein